MERTEMSAMENLRVEKREDMLKIGFEEARNRWIVGT